MGRLPVCKRARHTIKACKFFYARGYISNQSFNSKKKGAPRVQHLNLPLFCRIHNYYNEESNPYTILRVEYLKNSSANEQRSSNFISIIAVHVHGHYYYKGHTGGIGQMINCCLHKTFLLIAFVNAVRVQREMTR